MPHMPESLIHDALARFATYHNSFLDLDETPETPESLRYHILSDTPLIALATRTAIIAIDFDEIHIHLICTYADYSPTNRFLYAIMLESDTYHTLIYQYDKT